MAIPDARVGCSTISFRAKDLPDALTTIRDLGFSEIDLGAIPAVVDHVPIPLDAQARHMVEECVSASGLRVRAVNSDPGPLSDPRLDEGGLEATVTELCTLAATFGATLILPCGAPSTEPLRDLDSDLDLVARRLRGIAQIAEPLGVRVLVEAPHLFRLCNTVERAEALLQRVDHSVAGAVLDASHVVASGGDLAAWARKTIDRTEHVQLRDARPGNINLSVGNGDVDFAALVDALVDSGYDGHYCLELETHDIADDDRPAEAARVHAYISDLLRQAS